MSRLLIDSNAFLWYCAGDPQITRTAVEAIGRSRDAWISSATPWELSIKCSTGRLTLPGGAAAYVRQAVAAYGFGVLGIEWHHLSVLESLPFHHKDPFDRLMIAQAIAEGIPIASSDEQFDAYGITRVWK